MASSMKIRLFSAISGGERVMEFLRDANGRAMVDRNLPMENGGYIRIDHLEEFTTPQGETLWLMNFVRSRESRGPLKVSLENVEAISYDGDQSPGEEIAALFIPETSNMLIEMNNTFRIAKICQYANDYARRTDRDFLFDLEALSDDNAYRTFRTRGKLKRVTFALATRNFTSAERDAGMALGGALQMGDKANASFVEVKLVARGNGYLNDEVVEDTEKMLNKFQEALNPADIFNQDEENAKTARGTIGARDTADSAVKKLKIAVLDVDRKMAVLDLIAPYLQVEYEISLDEGRRFPLPERYSALKSAYTVWRDTIRRVAQD